MHSRCLYFLQFKISTIFWAAIALASSTHAVEPCVKPLYLTFDTGHMGIAPLVAEVLQRQRVPVTFFAAHEPTKEGDGSLGDFWAPWWQARAKEGHAFASHTWDHTYWRADQGTAIAPAFKVKPSSGSRQGQEFVIPGAEYCRQLKLASDRLALLTGQNPLPLFRAPGGKTSQQLRDVAQACGYAHVGWSPAGFLGDELSSDLFSNKSLLHSALSNIRSGDILMAHLGIWSRKDPWAPAVLEPLIIGLKKQGFCFRTLRDHPEYIAGALR